MLFDEEFQKLAAEKGMSCSELANKIIELMCDDEGNYTFGPPSCLPHCSSPNDMRSSIGAPSLLKEED